MKRPVVVIVGIAAGLLLVAAAGASAHTALHFVSGASSAGNILSDEASAPRSESPEPTESPEQEPTEQPEPTAAPSTEPADNDNEQGDEDQGDNEQGDNDNQGDTGDSSGSGD